MSTRGGTKADLHRVIERLQNENAVLRSIREAFDRQSALLNHIQRTPGRVLQISIGEGAVSVTQVKPEWKVLGSGLELLGAIQDAVDAYDAEYGHFHALATRHRKRVIPWAAPATTEGHESH